MAITHLGRDYLYADTDSVKFRNPNAHLDWFNKFNDYVNGNMEKALKWHKIDFSLSRPKTIKGVEKPLGIFEFDGRYQRFKTLGAKKYLYQDMEGKLHLTCSGIKKDAIEYMIKQCNGDVDKVFDMFDNGMTIPSSDTGKKTHTYIDEEMKGYLKDYLGNVASYHELSGIHLEGASFTIDTDDYMRYLDYLREVCINDMDY